MSTTSPEKTTTPTPTPVVLDDYLTIVPRGLQDVVQTLLPLQIRQNSVAPLADGEKHVVIVEKVQVLGEDSIHFNTAHLQDLQARVTTAMVKKQQKKRQRLSPEAQAATATSTTSLTRAPYGTLYDAKSQRHVGVGYDYSCDKDNDSSSSFPVWSLPGVNTGTVWLRFSTNATPAAVAACRCIGPLLALVHTYSASSTGSDASSSTVPTRDEVLQDLQNAMTPFETKEEEKSTEETSSLSSTKWNRALSLWQRHLRPNQSGDAESLEKIKYRCSCVRDDSKKYPYARHELLQEAAKFLIPPGADDAWQVNLKDFALEIVWLYRPHASVVALSLRNYAAVGALAFGQGQALPPDITPPYLQGDLLKDMIRLRPSTAQLLLHMARLQEGDVVVDPCVGIGTIVMECLHLAEPSHVIAMGGDLELKESLRSKAAEYQRQTRQWLAAPLQQGGRRTGHQALLCAWNAATLPLATASVDAIVSDLPFGRSCLSSSQVAALVPALLNACARVLRPSTGRMVLLCGNPQVLLDAMHHANQKEERQTETGGGLVWELPAPTCRPVNIGGHLVWILRVARGSASRQRLPGEEVATVAASVPTIDTTMNDDMPRTVTKRRVCLFGLSADPPTGSAGHLGIARKLASLSAFDEIRVLPVYRHTFTSKRMRLATYEDRMAMCRIAFEGLDHTVVTNDEYLSWCRKVEGITNEEERAQVSVGTAALLEYLLERQGQAAVEFTFCLGADAFMDLTAGKWKESDRVLQLLQGRFLVLNRMEPNNCSGGSNDETTINKANDLQARVASIPGAQLVSVDSLGAVSSSQVRQAVAKQDWTLLQDEAVLHPGVLAYIRDKQLYTPSL